MVAEAADFTQFQDVLGARGVARAARAMRVL